MLSSGENTWDSVLWMHPWFQCYVPVSPKARACPRVHPSMCQKRRSQHTELYGNPSPPQLTLPRRWRKRSHLLEHKQQLWKGWWWWFPTWKGASCQYVRDSKLFDHCNSYLYSAGECLLLLKKNLWIGCCGQAVYYYMESSVLLSRETHLQLCILIGVFSCFNHWETSRSEWIDRNAGGATSRWHSANMASYLLGTFGTPVCMYFVQLNVQTDLEFTVVCQT